MRTSDWRVLYGCNSIVDVRPCSMWIWWQFHMSWAWTALFINIFFHQCLLVSSVRVFSMLFVSSGRLPAAQWTIFCGSETDLWDRGCPGSLQLELDPDKMELWASRAQLLGIHIDYWLHLITIPFCFSKRHCIIKRIYCCMLWACELLKMVLVFKPEGDPNSWHIHDYV